MKKDVPIRDEACEALCPGNRSEGENALNAILAEAEKKIRRLDLMFKLTLMSSVGCAMLTMLFLILTDSRPAPRPLAWGIFVIALAISGGIFVLWQHLQHRSIGRKFLPDELIPVELKQLISEYAKGDRRVYTSTGTVPRELFHSHWAILLFSDRAEMRGWVRSANAKRTTREIYAVAEAGDVLASNSATAETPARTGTAQAGLYAQFLGMDRIPYKGIYSDKLENLNNNPDHQWIVGGSRAEYEMGREKAMADEIPYAATWKAFVLDGARFELRKSGQDRMLGFAYKQICAELVKAFGSDLTPNGKPSKSLIMKMLSTGKHNAAFREHFRRSE
jgi:hypothetical protein